MTTLDHKAAKAWANQCIGGPDVDDANLARCYLDLREKALRMLDCIETLHQWNEFEDSLQALRAILGDDHE